MNKSNTHEDLKERCISLLADPFDPENRWETPQELAGMLGTCEEQIRLLLADPPLMREVYRRFFARFQAKVPEYLASLSAAAVEKGNVNAIRFILQMAAEFGSEGDGAVNTDDILKLLDEYEQK